MNSVHYLFRFVCYTVCWLDAQAKHFLCLILYPPFLSACHVDDHDECETVQWGKGHLTANSLFLSEAGLVLIKENLLSHCEMRLIKKLLRTCQLKTHNGGKVNGSLLR